MFLSASTVHSSIYLPYDSAWVLLKADGPVSQSRCFEKLQLSVQTVLQLSLLIWSLLVLYKTPLTYHLSMPMLSLLLVFLEVSLCVWTIPLIWFQTVESGHSSTTVLWVGRTQMWVNGRGRSVYISRTTDTSAAPQSSLTNGCCALPTASSSLVQSESVYCISVWLLVFLYFILPDYFSVSCSCYQRRKLDIC